MFFRFLLCVFLVIQTIHGKSDDEIRSWYLQQAIECNKEFPVSQEEMHMLQKHKIPDNKNAKCLLNCVFKKTNLMNDKGMFDEEKAVAQSTSDYEGDDKKIENSKKLMDICKKVNSETVEDGEAGCDRALLLFKCFTENAAQLGFPMHTTS